MLQIRKHYFRATNTQALLSCYEYASVGLCYEYSNVFSVTNTILILLYLACLYLGYTNLSKCVNSKLHYVLVRYLYDSYRG